MDKHSWHKKHWNSDRHAVVSNIFQCYSLQKALLVGKEEKRKKLWGLVMLMLAYCLLIVAATCLPTHPHAFYWAKNTCNDTTSDQITTFRLLVQPYKTLHLHSWVAPVMCDIWTDINATDFVKGQFLSQGVPVTNTSDVINHFAQQSRLWGYKNISASITILEILCNP